LTHSTDPFDEPYWNLDQVYVWAQTRAPDLVVHAASWAQGGPAIALELTFRKFYADDPTARRAVRRMLEREQKQGRAPSEAKRIQDLDRRTGFFLPLDKK
jgi:hypothetical protein